MMSVTDIISGCQEEEGRMNFRPHMPGFISIDPDPPTGGETLADMLNAPQPKRFAEGEMFDRFSHIASGGYDTLMAEMTDGKFWVVGYVTPAGSLSELPKWNPPSQNR